MNTLHIRYFVISLVVTALLGSLIAGWGHMTAAGLIGILAGRKVGREYAEPNMGKAAGIAVGLWVGLGAVLGSILAAVLAVSAIRGAQITLGATLFVGLISLIIAVFASAIAGRESVKPIEDEM